MLPSLAEQFCIQPGDMNDYRCLSRFHYRAQRPATLCLIRRFVYLPSPSSQPILAGVATLSWPTLRCHVREDYFALADQSDRRRALWLRDNLRTISRVIIHPRFRGIGLASRLACCLCDDCPVPYAEAIASMGAVHPLFRQAGMTAVTPTYYVKQTHSNPFTPITKPHFQRVNADLLLEPDRLHYRTNPSA
jgi:hypothetical protein